MRTNLKQSLLRAVRTVKGREDKECLGWKRIWKLPRLWTPLRLFEAAN
jgi:hypothetical protein